MRGVAGGRLRFAEEGVSIRHRRHCRIGSGSVLEAHARLDCLGKVGVQIGQRVTVGKFSILEVTGVLWRQAHGIQIGDDTGVGDFTFIGGGGGVTIGRRVLMGQRISIHSENHVFSDSTRPIRDQGVTRRGVRIGDDCWLGAGVIVLDGVTLGQGCVVAAGAVVTRSFPDGSIIAGVPAKLVDSSTGRRPDVGDH